MKYQVEIVVKVKPVLSSSRPGVSASKFTVGETPDALQLVVRFNHTFNTAMERARREFDTLLRIWGRQGALFPADPAPGKITPSPARKRGQKPCHVSH